MLLHSSPQPAESFLELFPLPLFDKLNMPSLATTLLGLGSAALVAAHGYVDNATINGEVYTFYQPYTDPYTSPTVSPAGPVSAKT